jgi:cytochrome P450
MQKGARRCPGSRVAQNEILAMIAQLILNRKISFADGRMPTDIKYDSSPIKPLFPKMKFEAR